MSEQVELSSEKMAHFITAKCFTHKDLVALLDQFGLAHQLFAKENIINTIKSEVAEIEKYHSMGNPYDDNSMQQDILILLKSIE